MIRLLSLRAQAELERRRRTQQRASEPRWPDRCIVGPTGQPVPFHRGQVLAWESERRIVALVAGSQGGKTAFGPWWLARETQRVKGGDLLAVTANYDLFKLKMLPAMLEVFEGILKIGRYWGGDRVIEICDPQGAFWAKRSTDSMYGRVILRSAQAGRNKAGSVTGLESATARAAWLDEAGMDDFTVDAWKAIRRRLALHRGRVFITTTLYNLGWLKQEVMDKATESGTVALERIGAGEVEYTDNAAAGIGLVQFDSIVNPAYPIEEYEEARASMPDDEFQMFWRGRIAKLRTLVYDIFDRKQHTCPRFAIPDAWKRFVGLDFGDVHTAAVFYAQEPSKDSKSGRLFCYREYLEGGRTAKEHAHYLLEGEPRIPDCVGGSKSEGQWRREFASGGLPVKPPQIAEVSIGINRVYGCHKRGEIIYFDDLSGILDEKGRYRRKRDKTGQITDEIENKDTFHRLDAERYIIGYIKGGTGWTWKG